MDFLVVEPFKDKSGWVIEPEFNVGIKSKDLMIRGGDFYAIWLEDQQRWSTDELDVIRLVDGKLRETCDKAKTEHPDSTIKVHWMWKSSSGMINRFHNYCQKQCRDNFVPLDERLTFENSETTKESYSSKKLPYALLPGDYSAWDKILGTLYAPDERHKLEWAIGAIVTGDSRELQKFMVLYGGYGTGKSTILNTIQSLFDGYYAVFDAKALGKGGSEYALEPFKSNPLVGIQHDGDLSHIEDNTRLNSLTSHEKMTVNEKYKSLYSTNFKAFLFIGSNEPVKITNAKSGLLRRLIDVQPSGNKLPKKEYLRLTKQLNFELGAIAWHCQEVYLADPNFYDDYVPTGMLEETNDFYNFVADNYTFFDSTDPMSLNQAWDLYKIYAEETHMPYPLSKLKFKDELKNYYKEYMDRAYIDGERVRNYYKGFLVEKFENIVRYTGQPTEKAPEKKEIPPFLVFKECESPLDIEFKDAFAQYANDEGKPLLPWDKVTTTLKDIDTSKLHYVRPPDLCYITADFDIPDENGNKCLEKNIEAAKTWPPTYAELSKSGQGIHLEYIYTGDPSRLSCIFGDNIEIKVFTGKSSLRRKLSKNNGMKIAKISSGLPLREEKPVVSEKTIQNDRHLHALIIKCLAKEYGATKPSMDFIEKLLDEAYNAKIVYDCNDLAPDILAFALGSTHQSKECLKIFNRLKFSSDEIEPQILGEYAPSSVISGVTVEEDDLIFFDLEVFPNLLLINWTTDRDDAPIGRMINPEPKDIRPLLNHKLVGFNNRRYDNHILYARYLGYSIAQIYEMSQRIIVDHIGLIRDAYNVSFTDIYDFAATKQSLKKWEIEMGIHHQELGLPWNKPVPEELWPMVSEYCDNDVIATKALFHYLKGDWKAREILAKIAGMTPNDTTNMLTKKIIFGNDEHPQLECPDLSLEFPGYEYIPASKAEDHKPHNMYRGIDLGFGGYVKETIGYWLNLALLDVRSLHPHSIIAMNALGKYTARFKDLVDIRVAIKQGDFEAARSMFDGALVEYLDDPAVADALSQALKIAINSVYGLTSASFDNAFKDPRNVNNIVALRGALFMKTLEDEVIARGFVVAHIKTDSIKIPNATMDIIQFCYDFARKYGYVFEHEATYEKMVLVNKAVYIAKYATLDKCRELYGSEYIDSAKDICKNNKKHGGDWTATGKEFQIGYVFKKLFTKEPIVFDDICETYSTNSALYLDFNEGLPDVTNYDKVKALRLHNPDWTMIGEEEYKKDAKILRSCKLSDEELDAEIAKGHDYAFIGKVGQFCPVKEGYSGGYLMREQDGKYYFATGSSGYRWVESETLRKVGTLDNDMVRDRIDFNYWNSLVDTALDDIKKFVDPNEFID